MSRYRPHPAELNTMYRGAVRIWISGPSIVDPGEPFDLRVSLLQLDGYLASEYEGNLIIRDNSGIANLPEKIKIHFGCGFQVSNRGLKKTSQEGLTFEAAI